MEPSVTREEGLRLLKAGQVDDAVRVLTEVIRADEDDALAHMYLGAAFNTKGDKLHAIHHFEESLRLEETAKGYYNLALIYEAVHRLDEAVRQYRMAIEIDANYAPAQEALNRLHNAIAPPLEPADSSSVACEQVAAVGAAAAIGQMPPAHSFNQRPSGPPDPLVRQIEDLRKVRDAHHALIRSGVIYGAIAGAFTFVAMRIVLSILFLALAGSFSFTALISSAITGVIFGSLVGLWIGYTNGEDTAGLLAGFVLTFVFYFFVGLLHGWGLASIVLGVVLGVIGAIAGFLIGKIVDSSIGQV